MPCSIRFFKRLINCHFFELLDFGGGGQRLLFLDFGIFASFL